MSSPAEAFPWQSKADKQIRRSVQCWCIQTSRRPFKYWYHIWKLISNVYKTNQSIFSIIEPAEGSLLGLVPPLRDPRPALELFVTISTEKMQQNLNQPEDVDGLSVAAAGEEGSAGREWEREDGGGSLQTSAQLVQLRSVVAREHSVMEFFFMGIESIWLLKKNQWPCSWTII